MSGPFHETSEGNAGHLPQLVPDQTLKLKQLTMLTLAETDKDLPYDILMQELDVTNVRELEDFLINECIHVAEEAAIAAWKRALGALSVHLASNTYLVGHAVTWLTLS
ncbi:COP9 signalosome complex subunit 7 [Camellia lanceoleosa]|uniref:COP9 signalosome complex subunit 7 n=1 Tax=Camellia lanceoleosa TaxID=1840588 RepID=A0ACC0GX08_9ERIC|nr:COP9 signalosome complex subunit 7 [Camellia lanceoleosa]